MGENQLREKILKEAETVEIPKELEPDQIRMRIEETPNDRKKKTFRWHRPAIRGAAAAIALIVFAGGYAVANRQGIVPTGEEVAAADAATTSGAKHMTSPKKPAKQADAVVEEKEEEPVRILGDYHLASGYEEVRDMLNQLMDSRGNQFFTDGAIDYVAAADGVVNLKEEAAAEDSTTGNSAMFEAESKKEKQQTVQKDYSTTNLQVTGVDESDIVKTDGEYIYIATNDKVQIVDATKDTPKQIASIRPAFEGNMDCIREMYVADQRLILIIQTEDTDGLADTDDFAQKKLMADIAYGPGWFSNQVHTKVLTYDITDPNNASLVGTFTQDGNYHTSRKIGDQLYLCTDYGYPMNYRYVPLDYVDEQTNVTAKQEESLTQEDVKEHLPQVQGQTIPEDCIYLPKDGTESGVLLTAVDIKEPEKATDRKLIFCGYSTLYVTGDTILLYRSDYDMASDRSRTKLTKFAIGDGRITAKCAEAVPGHIEDTFAIHENKDGYVYVLTTDYAQNGPTNQLYVLDEKLKICGRIEHIADGENVYAARFVDEIGYFVTYRNMDPLFTVDFSNPRKPKLIGELEIPGFSDYLQFWDDTHLIGVGEERKEKDSEFVGIKVSLYDISDPTDVKESSKYVMEDAQYAPAQYNYKALLADSKKNVIAFLTSDKDEDMKLSQRIFTVKGKKIKSVAKDTLQEGNEYYSPDNYRNLYIGDKLYLAREGLLLVYDMNHGFERIATCKLTE